MLRTALAATLVLAATALTGSSAVAAGARPTPCANTYYAPMYQHITHIRQTHTTCRVARLLSLAYARAITSSSDGRTGQCFGAKTYGLCEMRYRRQTWACFHYDVVPKKTRGLVRCKRAETVVAFNIGS